MKRLNFGKSWSTTWGPVHYSSTFSAANVYESNYPIVIGNTYGGTIYKWNKPIDYIRIYKKALRTTGVYNDTTNYVNTNRNDIQWLLDHRASIWANSYYGDYPSNKYTDE